MDSATLNLPSFDRTNLPMSQLTAAELKQHLAELERLRSLGAHSPADLPEPAELLRYLEAARKGSVWPVDRLHYVRRARTQLDVLEHQVVTVARLNRVPWSSIGAVNDVSASAALQRHAALSDRLGLPRATDAVKKPVRKKS